MRTRSASALYQIEVFFEFRQSLRRALHFGAEFFQLLLHERSKTPGGLEANVICVVDVTAGNRVGNVGRKLSIGRSIGNKEQVCVRGPSYSERREGEFQIGIFYRWTESR